MCDWVNQNFEVVMTEEFDRIFKTLEEHEEKHPGSNYVEFPIGFELKRLCVLTKYGKKMLANEGLCGTMKLKKLQAKADKLVEALELHLEFFELRTGEMVTEELMKEMQTMSIAREALKEYRGEND